MDVQGRTFTQQSLNAKFEDWNRSHSLFVATDIIGTALLIESANTLRIHQVADAILSPGSYASAAARRAAQLVLARHSSHHATAAESERELNTQVAPHPSLTRAHLYARVHEARDSVRRDLRSSLRWVELSQAWTLAGQIDRATEAMTNAISLAPNNRYVLRSATRLFVHAQQEEKAWWLLRGAERTPYDPWLLAAEVGVAGLLGQTPRFAKKGIALAASGNFGFRDLTELASGLGTLESEHGHGKKARKLFRIALSDPNENVLAQAAWGARTHTVLNIDADYLTAPLSFEAKARLCFRRKEWDQALVESQNWFNDQRFAVNAATFASHVAVVLARHDQAVAILKAAQMANPDSWILKNNLAFSLASLDRLEEAREVFADLPAEGPDSDDHAIWLATSGLLEFRSGNIVEGQRLYDESIATFAQQSLYSLRAIAAIFKAREELNAKLESACASVEIAKEFAAKATDVELQTLIAQLERPPEQEKIPLEVSNDA